MMKFKLADEPHDFDEKVRQPGLSSIEELIGNPPLIMRSGPRLKKTYSAKNLIPSSAFPSHWTECIPDLLTAYNRICQYSCFFIPPVTGNHSVDHLMPKSGHWDQVYEWSNYRLAAASVNSSKNKFTDVLDPFCVEDKWFAIEFVGCQVVAGDGIEEPLLTKINSTIERLALNSYTMRSKRYDIVDKFQKNRINKEEFFENAPFLAREFFVSLQREEENSKSVCTASTQVRCPLCRYEGKHLCKTCEYCDGRGTVSIEKSSEFNAIDYKPVKCPKCTFLNKSKCSTCDGCGVIYKKDLDKSRY